MRPVNKIIAPPIWIGVMGDSDVAGTTSGNFGVEVAAGASVAALVGVAVKGIGVGTGARESKYA